MSTLQDPYVKDIVTSFGRSTRDLVKRLINSQNHQENQIEALTDLILDFQATCCNEGSGDGDGCCGLEDARQIDNEFNGDVVLNGSLIDIAFPTTSGLKIRHQSSQFSDFSFLRVYSAQSNSNFGLGLGGAGGMGGRTFVIADDLDLLSTDFGIPVQSHPTLVLHSANSTAAEWMSIAHNGSKGCINSHTGPLCFQTIETEMLSMDLTGGNTILSVPSGTMTVQGSEPAQIKFQRTSAGNPMVLFTSTSGDRGHFGFHENNDSIGAIIADGSNNTIWKFSTGFTGAAQMTKAGGSDRTYTLPDCTGTVALLDCVQTWTAAQLFNSGITIVQGSTGFITSVALGGTRTWTFPDSTGTVPLLGLGQTWTANQLFPEIQVSLDILLTNSGQTNALKNAAAGGLEFENQSSFEKFRFLFGGAAFSSIFQAAVLTGNQTYTFPDVTGAIVLGVTGTFGTGSIPFGNPSGILMEDATELFWDATNNFLGIGTNGPQFNLDVAGGTVRRVAFPGPTSAPTDGDLDNAQWSVWVDEGSDLLTFRVKYSTGTLKTGTVALV
jgi:hypothetical protein